MFAGTARKAVPSHAILGLEPFALRDRSDCRTLPGFRMERVEGYMSAAEQDDPLLDTLLAGRYHLTSRLGKGGMAVVYKATDRQEGRQVAVRHCPFALRH